MIRDLIRGISSYFSSIAKLYKFGLIRYGLISFALSGIILLLIIMIIYFNYTALAHGITKLYPFEVGYNFVNKSSGIISLLLSILFATMLYKYIVLIFLSPLMSVISLRVERNLQEGKSLENNNSMSLWSGVLRGMRITARNLSRELLFSIPLIVLSFVPIVNIISTILLFVIQAYYVGFGSLDYYLERHLNYDSCVSFVKQNIGLSIGIGIGYLLIITFVPVIGFIIAPFLSTVAASYVVHPKIYIERFS